MKYGAWILGAVLALGASGVGAEALTSDQQASLDRLRQELWDQGYSDPEIQAELDRKRTEFAAAKPVPAVPTPPAPDAQVRAPVPAEDAALARLLGQIRELLDARIMTPDKVEEAQGKARTAWQVAAPADRSILLKDVRRKLKFAVVEAWRKELVKARTDKGLPFFKAQRDAMDALALKRRQLDDAQAALRKQGVRGDALVEKLKARFPEVPSVFFEAEGEEPPPLPPEEDVAGSFSDDEIDEIVDTMLEELDQAP